MKTEQKLTLLDRIVELVRETQTSEDLPVMVGTLNKAQGIKGFEKCDIGHPVFEYKGKYILYMKSETMLVEKDAHGNTQRNFFTVATPYNKENLAKVIDFI